MRSPHTRGVLGTGRYRRRRSTGSRAVAATTALTLGLLGVTMTGPTAAAADTTVSMNNQQYNPDTVEISTGDTVTWKNDDSESHSADGPGWQSPEIPAGGTFSRTFDSAGTFDIQCRFHPDMKGTVKVADGGDTPPPTTTTQPTTAPPTSTTAPTSSGTSVPTTSAPTSGQTPGDSSGGTVVGAGPLPVAFDLTDANGSWFDTNVNLGPNIGQSLAVAVLPRVNFGSVTNLVPGVKEGGLLSGVNPAASSEVPLLGVGSVPLADGGTVPLLGAGLLPKAGAMKALNGDLPTDSESALNVDSLRQAIDQLLPAGDARAAEADSLLDQFSEQAAAAPAGQPVALADLPVGPELSDFLDNLQEAGANDMTLPVTVNFTVAKPDAASAHTASALIWPEDAKGMPTDQSGAWVGKNSQQLTAPGLYAWACKIHPYMLGAVVVDDPLTPGLDFGKKLRVNSRNLSVPSDSDIIYQLVQKFFTITVDTNWQTNSDTEDTVWDPQYPPAPILVHNAEGEPELIPSLDAFLKDKFNTPKVLPKLGKKPATPGIGEVWIATQMEEFAEKTKNGSITKIDASDWSIDQKIVAPEINMNNTHNMWTDKDEKLLYANEWFNNKMDVFDRKTGKFIRQLEVGPDPSHVMSRTDTDQLHVAINAGGAVMEVAPGGTRIDRRIPVQMAGSKIAHPHAHWMTGDAKIMATPNVNTYNATFVDIPTGNIRHEETGELPIATGMTPDGSKTYMADFLGASVSCISNKEDACVSGGSKQHYKKIDLWGSYDPQAGPSGPFGGLPIQLPVSPDNSALLVANTLSSNVTVIDPKTDEIVKWLPCDAGCHGINFGAKKGGGYYAYVSSKFSNALSIIDTDPNGDGSPEDAAVVGKFVLDSTAKTVTDGTVTAWDGFGGQGVLPIPLAYEGWVQNVPDNAVNSQLTCRQRNPIEFATKCS